MPSSFGSANPANCTFSIYASYIPDSQEDTGLTGNPYMFTGRRFEIETGLYYYRARYYNPYIGRFLQTDPIGYGDGINWYTYCGNNPVNYKDPTGLWVYTTPIPAQSIWNVVASNDEEAYLYVEEFLRLSGFFDHWKGVKLIGVEISGTHYNCTFSDGNDAGVGEIPINITTTFLPDCDYPVVVCNSIGLLDEWALERIIYKTIQKINDWIVLNLTIDIAHFNILRFGFVNPISIGRLPKLDSPFHESPITEFLYKGTLYESCAINYIVQGHAHRHIGLTLIESIELVLLHNHVTLRVCEYFDGEDLVPSNTLLFRKLLWTLKGYREYDKRKYW